MNLAGFYCLSIIDIILFHSLFDVEAEFIVFNLTLVSGFMPLSNRACNITRKININDEFKPLFVSFVSGNVYMEK